jgi:hypothetical protein
LNGSNQPEAVVCERPLENLYWPNTVVYDQQPVQPQPVQTVISTGIRSLLACFVWGVEALSRSLF